eukprot:TRINITY_DN1268_c0_g1_i2.p1 TRINITY_DN1268_c0_g1~~TRINITY_DN1268_c0_g1_i2.p1  ORF type:complete len:588 (+),score=60.52 TRINITY_DN1268_c0_g1_i2:1138-2901(+)
MANAFNCISGRIRKLIAEGKDSTSSRIVFTHLPGGVQTFDLAIKFCYGINFEITPSNVGQLRCLAEYLEMTQDYGEENLIARTEAYVKDVVAQSLEKSIDVLRACENLLPLAEQLKVVDKCVDSIASRACKEQMALTLARLDYSSSDRLQGHYPTPHEGCSSDWWIEDLTALRIDMYQKVILCMKSKGVRHESIVASLIQYAQEALKGFCQKWTASVQTKVSCASATDQHEQRMVVETIVSLLPNEKRCMPVGFLFGLLRTAVMLDTTIACRLDLERRIGQHLELATLDDLLIPSFSHSGDTIFDVDIVHRILVNFLQQNDDQNEDMDCNLGFESDGLPDSPSQAAVVKVARLIDGYLAEIAPDASLKLSKFIAIAELLPDHARTLDDGLYRAIDIYLKAHPGLTEAERRKICKLMDCQKLSQEASTHAAQNERLPVQIIVQVLYMEQLRLRNALDHHNYSGNEANTNFFYASQRMHNNALLGGSGAPSAAMSPRDNYASLRRENRELKLEIARMRMRLNDLEKAQISMKEGFQKSSTSNRILSSISKKLSKISFFHFSKYSSPKPSNDGKESDTKKQTRRIRHSIS